MSELMYTSTDLGQNCQSMGKLSFGKVREGYVKDAVSLGFVVCEGGAAGIEDCRVGMVKPGLINSDNPWKIYSWRWNR